MHIFASLSLIKLCHCTHCYVTPNLAIIIQAFMSAYNYDTNKAIN